MLSMPTFYHGTGFDFASQLEAGEALDAHTADKYKIDGVPGFYLAVEADDAIYFALRRSPGVLLRYDISQAALDELTLAGAVLRPIPLGKMSQFDGPEFFVPPAAFGIFNLLRTVGEVQVYFHP